MAKFNLLQDYVSIVRTHVKVVLKIWANVLIVKVDSIYSMENVLEVVLQELDG